MSLRPKRIILIVLDTLRADHVGYYGYKRETTPNLDAFCAECVVFKYAFSTCSYTVPSHASIFTGKYPHRHSAGFSNGPPTSPVDNDLYITEILSDAGYETGGFVSSIVLGRENGGSLIPGFKTYDDCMTNVELNRPNLSVRPGEETMNSALQWLDGIGNKDLFLFLHYFDVHGPYINKPPYDSLFVNDDLYGAPELIENIVPDDCAYGGIPAYQVLRAKKNGNGELMDYEKDANFYNAQYDGGIRYVDHCLGLLFMELKKRGIYDDALIFVTSDHGEALGENSVWFFHGLTVTLDQVHVPLMIKPHLASGVDALTVYEHVSLADIFSTMCHIVGFDYDHLDIDGHTLWNLIDPRLIKDPEMLSRKIISEIEGEIAYIDTLSMCVFPRTVDAEKPKYFYLEHLCSTEMTYPYRFGETNAIRTSCKDFIPFLVYDIYKLGQLYRYQFACKFVDNFRVLNYFCGDYAGPQMLSFKAKDVTGASIDEALINYSRKACTRPNINFLNKSPGEVTLDEVQPFDAIICFLDFNSLEQLNNLFPQIKRLLKTDGIAIFSVPNLASSVGYVYSWDRYYFERYSFADLVGIFRSNFSYLYWYQQKICPSFQITSVSSSPDENSGQKFVEKELVRKSCALGQVKNDISHFIVLCSQTEKSGMAGEEDNLFAFPQDLISYTDQYVHSLRLINSKIENKIQEMKKSLEKSEAELKHIRNSNGWKMLTRYYQARDKILPPSSVRRRIVEAIWNNGRK
jgi:SAM-dependent methyltransferase